jgi:hypothetical protein
MTTLPSPLLRVVWSIERWVEISGPFALFRNTGLSLWSGTRRAHTPPRVVSALSILGALGFPRHEASGVEMVFVRLKHFAVLPEHSLKLHLSAPHCLATDRARLTAPRTAHRAVRTSRWELPILNRVAGFLA